MVNLVKWDNAKNAILEAKNIDEIKDIRDKAEAFRAYAKQAGESLEVQNNIAEIKIRAERRAGEMLREMPKNEGNKFVRPSTDTIAVFPTLKDLGISSDQSSNWQAIAGLPDDKLEEHIARVKASNEELTTVGLIRLARDVRRVSSVSTNVWNTPERYIVATRAVLGKIDVDPASNEEANKTICAGTFFTEGTNGLGHDWPGKVWLNPPYGGIAAEFAGKLLQQCREGITTEAILLVNANSTDTGWFAPLWNHTLCFTDHRINFDSPDSEASGSTHGSVFVYLGDQVHAFVEHFKKFGPVVRRIDI